MGAWKHRLSNKNIIAKTATCSFCGDVAIAEKGGNKSWQCVNAIREQMSSSTKTREYGFSLAVARKIKHGKKCSICGSSDKLVVDHCHETGQVRGILCNNCNIGLGMFRDSKSLLDSATKYLNRFSKKQNQLF